MAYINQTMKKEIMAEVKKVLPKGWKVTAKIENSMKITLNVKLDENSADYHNNYLNELKNVQSISRKIEITNEYKNSLLAKALNKLRDALNCKNWDNSDVGRDYVNVGYFSEVNVIA